MAAFLTGFLRGTAVSAVVLAGAAVLIPPPRVPVPAVSPPVMRATGPLPAIVRHAGPEVATPHRGPAAAAPHLGPGGATFHLAPAHRPATDGRGAILPARWSGPHPARMLSAPAILIVPVGGAPVAVAPAVGDVSDAAVARPAGPDIAERPSAAPDTTAAIGARGGPTRLPGGVVREALGSGPGAARPAEVQRAVAPGAQGAEAAPPSTGGSVALAAPAGPAGPGPMAGADLAAATQETWMPSRDIGPAGRAEPGRESLPRPSAPRVRDGHAAQPVSAPTAEIMSEATDPLRAAPHDLLERTGSGEPAADATPADRTDPSRRIPETAADRASGVDVARAAHLPAAGRIAPADLASRPDGRRGAGVAASPRPAGQADTSGARDTAPRAGRRDATPAEMSMPVPADAPAAREAQPAPGQAGPTTRSTPVAGGEVDRIAPAVLVPPDRGSIPRGTQAGEAVALSRDAAAAPGSARPAVPRGEGEAGRALAVAAAATTDPLRSVATQPRAAGSGGAPAVVDRAQTGRAIAAQGGAVRPAAETGRGAEAGDFGDGPRDAAQARATGDAAPDRPRLPGPVPAPSGAAEVVSPPAASAPPRDVALPATGTATEAIASAPDRTEEREDPDPAGPVVARLSIGPPEGATAGGALPGPHRQRLTPPGTARLPSTGLGRDAEVVTGRLPVVAALPQLQDRIDPSAEAPPAAPDGTAGALRRNAMAFQAEAGQPLLALVVVPDADPGAKRDAGGRDGRAGERALAGPDIPLTVALPAGAPDAAGRAAALRAEGREIVLLGAGLPPGARPADAEVSLAAAFATVPSAIAVMEAAPRAFSADPALAAQIEEILAASGHGLLLQAGALGIAGPADGAGEAAVPAAQIDRLLLVPMPRADLLRELDRAAFEARRTGAAVVAVPDRPGMLVDIAEWAASEDSVRLGPLSAVLLRRGAATP